MKIIKATLLMLLMFSFPALTQAQTELLTNGGFEDGRAPWTETAGEIRTEGENSYFFADVEEAGEAFSVNLSQAGLDIAQDSVYTLSFNSSTSEGSMREMIVGIGLNVDPFTAATETITLEGKDSVYTVVLQANFASTDARVLFDMGADTGIVVLDNVSLVAGGELVEDPVAGPPSTAAPTPPAREAEDVISLFSDAYTDINVPAFRTDWSQGVLVGNVEIAPGDSIKQYEIGNFIGIQLESALDLTAMTHMHFDYYVADESVADGAVFNPKLSNHDGLPDTEGETSAIGYSNPVSTVGEWVSFDVALDNFTAEAANGLLNRDKIYQIVMTTSGTITDIFIDNLYFHNGNVITSAENTGTQPREFVLNQNYPNPFNPTTNISYSIPVNADVTLDVFNMQGQKVATLIDGFQTAGAHQVTFNAASLASGIYMYRLAAGNSVQVKKMLLIK